jgi:excisionase family DNA binding protein
MSDGKLLMTVREVAAVTGFSEGTLRHWVSQRRIPFIRISDRCVRFLLADVQGWLAAKRVASVDTGNSENHEKCQAGKRSKIKSE